MQNTSGIHPRGHRVLVFPFEVEQVSKGGIVIHAKTVEQEELGQIQGIVVEIGETAWLDQKGARWAQAGDKVIFARHAGLFYKGKDGKQYRLINDLDVVAKLDDDFTQKPF